MENSVRGHVLAYYVGLFFPACVTIHFASARFDFFPATVMITSGIVMFGSSSCEIENAEYKKLTVVDTRPCIEHQCSVSCNSEWSLEMSCARLQDAIHDTSLRDTDKREDRQSLIDTSSEPVRARRVWHLVSQRGVDLSKLLQK